MLFIIIRIKEKLNSLNVGCGVDNAGVINCDISFFDSSNENNRVAFFEDKRKLIDNFILCDGVFLPFRNDSFEKVICKQVIEHIVNPFLLIKELTRVSSKNIRLETVHRFGENYKRCFSRARKWHKKHHLHFFSSNWLKKQFYNYGFVCVDSEVLSYISFPNNVFRLFSFPFEIGLSFRKKKK